MGSADGGAPVDHSNDDAWDAATVVPSIMDLEGTNLRRLKLDFSGRTISVSDWSHP